MEAINIISNLFIKNGFVMSFIIVAICSYFAFFLSKLTKNRIHGSAIAIFIGLLLAYWGGAMTGGDKGFASFKTMAGVGFLGGGMLRDYAIISTAFGAKISEIKKCGVAGVISLLLGITISFVVGVIVAYSFGYTSVVDAVTIGAGTVTFIVGPVTGASLGASSDIIAISIAAGVVKSVVVMVGTPLVAKLIGLDNPQSAMVYGGLMGTTSGVAAGLAATDEKLVPYGAMTATFYTGLGCLLCPSVGYIVVKALLG